MHSIKIKHRREGLYGRLDYSEFPKLELVINFFIEIGGLVELVKDGMIEDKGFHYQTIFADLENNEVVLYDIDDEDDPPLKLKLPYEKFIKLLDRWWEVYKNLPDFIEISMDNEENIEIKAAEE